MQQLGLQDAYLFVHSPNSDQDTHPHEGFTFGFGVHDIERHGSDSDDSTDSEIETRQNLRRIDRLHMSASLLPHVSEAFTAFVARADHKAIVVAYFPPTFDMTSMRFKCPQELLDDQETVERLQILLDDLPGTPEQWWERAAHALRHEAMEYKRHHCPPADYNVLRLILSSSMHRVCPQGWHYLRNRGHTPASEASAYSMLVSLYERDCSYKPGIHLMAQLKGVLAGETLSHDS